MRIPRGSSGVTYITSRARRRALVRPICNGRTGGPARLPAGVRGGAPDVLRPPPRPRGRAGPGPWLMIMDRNWVGHWRELQTACASQAGSKRRDFWDRRAPGFALAPRRQDQPGDFMAFLGPWIHPAKTLIDVGGRRGAPVGSAGRTVAVGESGGAFARDAKSYPRKPNLTVVPNPWQYAEVGQADLVICVHVLYSVTDPVPFIEKLEAAATERVFVVMRDSPHTHPAERLAARGRARPPQLRECFMLLRQIGIAPDVTMFTHPTRYRFADLDCAVEECRLSAGPGFDEQAARAWLAENLQLQPDGVIGLRRRPHDIGSAALEPAARPIALRDFRVCYRRADGMKYEGTT